MRVYVRVPTCVHSCVVAYVCLCVLRSLACLDSFDLNYFIYCYCRFLLEVSQRGYSLYLNLK